MMVLGFVSSIGWVLAVAGAVMVLIAIKYISDAFADPSIFKNMIIAVVLAILGLVVGVIVILSTVLSAFGFATLTRGFGGLGGFTPPTNIATGNWVGLILGVISGLAVVWVLLVMSAFFVRRSYGAIASKTSIHMFSTAGLLYLIGAALTIVLVGFVLILVSEILNIVAFFSIPDQPLQTQQPQPVQPQAPST